MVFVMVDVTVAVTEGIGVLVAVAVSVLEGKIAPAAPTTRADPKNKRMQAPMIPRTTSRAVGTFFGSGELVELDVVSELLYSYDICFPFNLGRVAGRGRVDPALRLEWVVCDRPLAIWIVLLVPLVPVVVETGPIFVVALIPRLPMFRRTPGNSLNDRLNLKAIFPLLFLSLD